MGHRGISTMQMSDFFPLNQRVFPKNLLSLLLTIVIYLVVPSIFGILLFFLSWIPLIGWLLQLIGAALDLYCLVGIVLAIMKYLK